MEKKKISVIKTCLFLFLSCFSPAREYFARQSDCTHKNTQILLLIFGNCAMISLGDRQVCAKDAQQNTVVCATKTE